MANDRIVNIGGSANASAISIGDGSTAVVGDGNTTLSVNPAARLEAIEAILVRLQGLDPRVRIRLTEARDQLGQPEPDRATVAKLVGEALGYAKAADGFVQACDSIGPHVQALVHWLGAAASNLTSLLP